jgi:hypothetical protein
LLNHFDESIIGKNKMASKIKDNTNSSNAVYGLGFIGALIYFIGAATNFVGGLIGFLKALVWPAFLVYEALKAVGA